MFAANAVPFMNTAPPVGGGRVEPFEHCDQRFICAHPAQYDVGVGSFGGDRPRPAALGFPNPFLNIFYFSFDFRMPAIYII